MKTSVIIGLTSFLIGIVVAVIIGRAGNQEQWSDAHARTFTNFRDVLTDIASIEHQVAIPADPAVFVDWYRNEFHELDPQIEAQGCIDFVKKQILDEWGSPCYLISINGEIEGLGSPGPNRFWENGEGDDAVLMRSDLEKRRYQ